MEFGLNELVESLQLLGAEKHLGFLVQEKCKVNW
jgi:hypothetical protein